MISFLGAPIVGEPGDEARRLASELEGALSPRARRVLAARVTAAQLAAEGRAVELVVDGVPQRGRMELRLPGAEPAVRFETPLDEPTAPTGAGRLRAALEVRTPVLTDRLMRALRARSHERLWAERLPRAGRPGRALPVAGDGAPRAVLVGMHWLDVGGAERWALDTVRMVAEAGLVPVIVTDRASRHPLATAPELRGAVWAVLGSHDGDALLRGILAAFDVRGVLVHHSRWLYDRLAEVRASLPAVPIIDSLHIIEFGGGGFPVFAVREDASATAHHVISPVLAEWLVEHQGVAPEKVVMAPLATRAPGGDRGAEPAPRRDPEALVIAWIGRLVRQKRPYLMLRLVAELVRSGAPVRVILHGDGELDAHTARGIRRLGLAGVVERRGSADPVPSTLAAADLLVLSSAVEGITLTTFEAVDAGVPVLSADVGSQRTVVPPAGLVPAEPGAFVREAADRIRALARDEQTRRALWQEERRLVDELAAHEDAATWMRRTIATWAE